MPHEPQTKKHTDGEDVPIPERYKEIKPLPDWGEVHPVRVNTGPTQPGDPTWHRG